MTQTCDPGSLENWINTEVVVQYKSQIGETNQVWGNHRLLSFKENEGKIKIIFLKKK